MRTVAEIKAAISQLPRSKRFDLGLWQAKELGLRLYTDDGLDVEEVRAKVQEAQRGEYHTVNPQEQIAKLLAGLDREVAAGNDRSGC